MMSNDITYDEYENNVDLINRLRNEHILMLSILFDPKSFDANTGGRVGNGGGVSTSLVHILTTLLPEWTQESIDEIIAFLHSERLTSIRADKLNTMISDQGIHHLEWSLTAKGRRFCEYILKDTSQEGD